MSLTPSKKFEEIMSFLYVEQETEEEYLCSLKEILDVYLLQVMEEEDPLFKLMKIDYSSDFGNIKMISPDFYQLNLVFSLPLQPGDIEVLYSPGFVEMKLPINLDERVQYSKVWLNACNRGLQNSLIRHLKLWKNEDNYLMKPAFNSWLSGVVDKALKLTGQIPDYKLRRLEKPYETILEVTDCVKSRTLALLFMPVFIFPSAQLPQEIASCVEERLKSELENDEWMVECRPHQGSARSQRLWGVSLWPYEQEILARNSCVGSITRLIEGLRNSSIDLKELTNYHIKTHVMSDYCKNPSLFGESHPFKLLLQVLQNLQISLVSPAGIPFFWDGSHNILCGLTGQQRADTAVAVRKMLKELDKFNGNPFHDIMPYFSKYSSNQSSPSAVPSRRESDVSEGSVASSVSSDDIQSQLINLHRRSTPSTSSRSASAAHQLTSRNQFIQEGTASSRFSPSTSQAQAQNGNNWLWGAAAVGAVGAAIVLVSGVAKAMQGGKNKN